MPEAEDVIVDAARHATEFVQAAWRRQRPRSLADERDTIGLAACASRLALLLSALHGGHWTLHAALAPPPLTLLSRLFTRQQRPWPRLPIPSAANGRGGRATIWLPQTLDNVEAETARTLYRAMALQQAERLRQRPADLESRLPDRLQRDVFLVLEAQAADAALATTLPGLAPTLVRLRAEALRRRPPLDDFPPPRQPLEDWLRTQYADQPPRADDGDALIEAARAVAEQFNPQARLFKDLWTGDWPDDEAATHLQSADHAEIDDAGAHAVRSARLTRRPRIRQAQEGEDDDRRPGAFMVQTAQPHEHAEDPMGAQRPTDRDGADSQQAAEGHAESVADLAQARLVRTAQRAHEVLLTAEPPPMTPNAIGVTGTTENAAVRGIAYPEWDYRQEAYRRPGAIVYEMPAAAGSAEWVKQTLTAQRVMLGRIRSHFELLRARRVIEHRQDEGDEIDLDACIEAHADRRGGASPSQRLYQRSRLAQRDTAIVVLVDISGSTDSWLGGRRRIIDVEREALLPLSIALDSLGEAHAILAFSGDGPQRVNLRRVKGFDERHDDAVALRIAGLEPERYTRAGAALRHAAALLAARPARHRLFLLLSDGRPNDRDEYEGRYGVEDMRQAVLEARRAGLSTFCLTVDRQAEAYLPRIFGPHHYALLQQPERLPAVLLYWLKRLLNT